MSWNRGVHTGLDELWRLLLAAWLGREALGSKPAKGRFDDNLAAYVVTLRDRLGPCRLKWLAGQADSCSRGAAGGSAGRVLRLRTERAVARRAGGAPGAGHGKARRRRERSRDPHRMGSARRQTRSPGGYRAAGAEARYRAAGTSRSRCRWRGWPATRSSIPGTPR
ncbi:MAG: hypothetical protein MZW92_26620 [Comamonadaceae bacterium]|nr:hypothetical protein [Comamonadaceae bacterium]